MARQPFTKEAFNLGTAVSEFIPVLAAQTLTLASFREAQACTIGLMCSLHPSVLIKHLNGV